MPFVNITTAKKIDAPAKEKLNQEICGIMAILPGKNKDNTLICLNDEKPMFKSGAPNSGVFVEVRLFGKSPDDAKKEFAQKMRGIITDVLKLEENDCLYMNFIENETWG